VRSTLPATMEDLGADHLSHWGLIQQSKHGSTIPKFLWLGKPSSYHKLYIAALCHCSANIFPLLAVTSFLKLGALATAQGGTMTQSLHLCLQMGTRKKKSHVWNGESLLSRL